MSHLQLSHRKGCLILGVKANLTTFYSKRAAYYWSDRRCSTRLASQNFILNIPTVSALVYITVYIAVYTTLCCNPHYLLRWPRSGINILLQLIIERAY